jgi:enoyl-CoA hydratase/carnithine racemase
MNPVVLSSIDNGIRTITLNRPDSLNAINGSLVEAVCSAFADANQDPETRVIIFTGAGRAFCAGADLKDSSETGNAGTTRDNVERLQQVTREIMFGPKIVIGAINGWAVGGGLEWVLNCDFTVWAENAGAFFPEIRLDSFGTGAVTSLLPRLVGQVKAKELMLFGDKMEAEELLRLGIAWKVVPAEQVLPEAHALASRILELPEGRVSDLKRVLSRVSVGEAETAMSLEAEVVWRSILQNGGPAG